jgi:AraC family transcriptional regulator of arabinose operon
MVRMKGFAHWFAVPALHSGDLTIRGIGVQEPMTPQIIDRPRGTGDHMLMLFYDEVWIAAGATPMHYPQGGLMLWTPGRRQYYGHAQKPYTHSWMHCDGRFIRGLLRDGGLPLNQPFEVRDPALMERHLLAMHEELVRYARPDEVIVRNLLTNWIRETARAYRGAELAGQGIPDAFLAVRHFMESEYAQPMCLAMLAKRLNLSVPHFCAEFKRHFGTSAIDYLIRQRMHQAAHLLKDRNLRVSEVARRVGYEDLFHFSRLFKKHFGASPRALRNG